MIIETYKDGLKLDRIERPKGSTFQHWHVLRGAKVIGIIRKGVSKPGYSFPYQAFLPSNDGVSPATLLGSWYGIRIAEAVNAIRNAH